MWPNLAFGHVCQGSGLLSGGFRYQKLVGLGSFCWWVAAHQQKSRRICISVGLRPPETAFVFWAADSAQNLLLYIGWPKATRYSFRILGDASRPKY